MSPDKRQRGMAGASASASAETEIIRRVTRSEDPLRDELLWGIPNEVTLQHIATNWPWRSRQVIATVSPDWRRAFQGRMVYNARVCSQSTETFLVVLSEIRTALGPKYVDICSWSEKKTLSLFSPREKCWYKLPPVPGCRSGLPSDCRYVILDGSLYLLGGLRRNLNIPNAEVRIPSAEVHVLDLAGHPLEWRRCANMRVPRRWFTVDVMQGKIFVFGGESEDTYFEVRNEVYDPQVDAWSLIAPAPIIPSMYFDVSQ